jgi:hypothetical protein
VFRRFDASAGWTDCTSIRRFDGTNWVPVNEIKRFDGNNWVSMWTSYIPPTANTLTLFDFGSHTGGGAAYTNGVVLPVVPGNRPLTYTWYYHSGDGNIQILHGSAATAAFTTNFINITTSREAVWRCEVSDGRTWLTFTVNVSMTNNRSGGGVEL